MKPLALILFTLAFCLAAGEASAYRTVEFQRCDTRIVEHAPIRGFGPRKLYVETPCRSYRARRIVRHKLRRAKVVVHRRVHRTIVHHRRIYRDSGAIAGGCRDGGFVRRRDALGNPFRVRREICDSIAPLSGRYAGPHSVRVPPVFIRAY